MVLGRISNAGIKYCDQKQLGEGRCSLLTLPHHSPSSEESGQEQGGRNKEAGTAAGVLLPAGWLLPPGLLALFSYTTQDPV